MEQALRRGTVLLVVLAAALLAACNPKPEPSPTPAPVTTPAPTRRPATPSPVPTPEPTPIRYRVKPGDSMAGIAQKFGTRIDRILRANRSIVDPNRIEVGQVIVIPPKGAPVSEFVNIDVIDDDENDMVDEDGRFTTAPGYADIYQVEARAERDDLLLAITVLGVPPRLSPSAERMTYRVVIDATADDEADYVVLYGNAVEPGPGYEASLEDLERGRLRSGKRFPGSDESNGSTIRLRVPLSALGNPDSLRVAARAERVFQPGGAEQTSIDDAPRPQWPERAAQWLEIEVG